MTLEARHSAAYIEGWAARSELVQQEITDALVEREAQLRAEIEHLPYIREHLRYATIDRLDRAQVLALFQDTH